MNKIAIIGAGLAGCSLAYELSKFKNYDITIFDKNDDIAQDASGNYAGILAPNLTADNNYSDQFHTLGYQLLVDFIGQYKNKIDICCEGALQLLSNDKENARYKKIFTKRNIPDSLALFLNNQATTKVIGRAIDCNSVYYPNAVSLEPKSLCELWLELSKVQFQANKHLTNIVKSKGGSHNWCLDFDGDIQQFDIVIFTGGYELFKSTEYLKDIPVFGSHGQLTVVEKAYDLPITIMDSGYIIPNYKENLQIIGATFRDNSDFEGDIRNSDDEFNISQIKEMLGNEQKITKVKSRVATRCVTADHIPIIGKLVNYERFKQDFYKPLSKGYPKSKMPTVEYEQGLYLASGFGSKGLCSSLLAAKIISSQIRGQHCPISEKLFQALSPQRFWVRSFKKGVKH